MIPSRKFSEILKRGILHNPCQKILAVESFLIKPRGRTLDLHFSENKFPPRMFYYMCIRIFSAFSVRSNLNSGFAKIVGWALQGCTLLKRSYTINLLKNVILRQLVFGTFFEKNQLWTMSIVYSRYAVCPR